MKFRLSLQNRIFLSLGGLALIALFVVWIIIRPKYEKGVVTERITILQQMQSYEVQNIDRQIASWIITTKSVAIQMMEQPKGGEALLVNAMTLFPNIVQIRVYSPGLPEEINSQNEKYPIPAHKTADSLFVPSSDPDVKAAWMTGLSSNPPNVFVTRTSFRSIGRIFFVDVIWDADILHQYLTRLPLGATYFLSVYAKDHVVYENRSDLRIMDTSFAYEQTNSLRVIHFANENWQTVTGTFQNAQMDVVVAVPEATIVEPVRQLLVFSSTLIIAIMCALLVLGWVLSRQISRPISMLVKDVERLEELNFKQSVRIPAMRELRKMGETIESMRHSLERYQRLNVDKIILEESKNKLLLSHSDELIGITSGDGRFLFRNAKFNELSKLLALDAYTATKGEVVNHPKFARLKETIQSENDGPFTVQFVQSELKIDLETELAQYYRVNDLTILRGNENLGSLIILHDLTNDRLIDQMKTDLMNVIIHELRSRVSSISMLSTFLAKHDVIEESKRRESLRLIVKSSLGLHDLITRFLDISRLESRRVEYTKEVTDIAEIVREELERMKLELYEKSLNPEFNVSAGVSPILVVPALIHDAVSNLLSNAVKYGDPGRTIEIALSRLGDSVALSVTDHGYGIPPAAQEKLFSKFYRVVTNAKAREQVGSGLGLAYVKEIAAYHNGKISLESNSTIGCTFTLTIPIGDEHRA